MSTTIRRLLPYALSIVGLLVLAAIGIFAESTPARRDLEPFSKPIFIGAKAPAQRLAFGMIDAMDLPFGWHRVRTNDIRVGGGIGRYSTWSPSLVDRPGLIVNEDLMIFSDPNVAVQVYEREVTDAVPAQYANKWIQPDDLQFTGHADRMKIACLPSKVARQNGVTVVVEPESQIAGEIHYSCVVIGLYGDTVLSLRGNVFQKRWLTMTQFRRLIERLDSKLEVARTP